MPRHGESDGFFASLGCDESDGLHPDHLLRLIAEHRHQALVGKVDASIVMNSDPFGRCGGECTIALFARPQRLLRMLAVRDVLEQHGHLVFLLLSHAKSIQIEPPIQCR